MKHFDVYSLTAKLEDLISDSDADTTEYAEGRYIYSVMFNMHDKVVDVHAQWPMVHKVVADLLKYYNINDLEVTCNLYQSNDEDNSAHIRVLCKKAYVVLTCFLEHYQPVKMLTDDTFSEDDLPSVEDLEHTPCNKLFDLWRELTGWLM